MKKLFLIISLIICCAAFAQDESDKFANRHVLYFGYDLATLSSFDEVEYSGDDVELTIRYERNFARGYEYRDAKTRGWGKSFGINHHFKRDVDELEIGGRDFEVTGNRANLTFTRLYGNAIYSWESLYLPFGLNYTMVDFEPASGSAEGSGGLGVNFGVGFNPAENWLLEGSFEHSMFSIEGGGTEWKDGSLSNLTLWLKYMI